MYSFYIFYIEQFKALLYLKDVHENNIPTINCTLEKIKYTITATMLSGTGGLKINDSTYTMTLDTPLEIQVEPGTNVYLRTIDTTKNWHIKNSSNETYIATGTFNSESNTRTFVMPSENLSFTFYMTNSPQPT